MPLESLSDEPPQTLRIPSRHTLVPLVEVFIVAYMDIMGIAAAEPPQKHTSAAAAKAPSMDAMRVSIQEQIPLLDSEIYKTREQASIAILRVINATVERRNPLPPEFIQVLDAQKISAEQRSRLRVIRLHAEDMEEELPRRIASPIEENMTTDELLSRQFAMPLLAEDPEIQGQLKHYSEGYEGQPSAEALYNLCTALNCIPELTQKGIILKPAQDRVLRMNNEVLVVERPEQDGVQKMVFAMPDQAALLTSAYTTPYQTELAPGVAAPWKDMTGDVPCPHTGVLTKNDTIKVAVGSAPKTRSISVSKPTAVEIGPQSYELTHLEQQANGMWRISMIGGIFEDIPWECTELREDMQSYQFAAASRFSITNEEGDTEYCAAGNMTFTIRNMSFTLCSTIKPATITIKAYSKLAVRRIKLP